MEQSDWMERLRRDPESLRSIIQSQDGQRLMALLSGNDGGRALKGAAMQAAGGNTGEMVEMIRRVMETPDGAALIRRITDTLQK